MRHLQAASFDVATNGLKQQCNRVKEWKLAWELTIPYSEAEMILRGADNKIGAAYDVEKAKLLDLASSETSGNTSWVNPGNEPFQWALREAKRKVRRATTARDMEAVKRNLGLGP